MVSNRLITLTTDFGEGSPYVAEMKSAILNISPSAVIVDITHSVGPQDIRHGALVLKDVALGFPPETVHIGVVDPGVGTQRNIVYACFGRQRFIAPDNGLLSLIARHLPSSQIVTIQAHEYWHANPSSTFHGRDIMAPVAAHLSLGVAPEKLGAAQEKLVDITWPEVDCGPDAIEGAILAIDHFGNLLTNIDRAILPASPARNQIRVVCRGRTCEALVEAYGDRPAGSLIALIGSSDRLEIAVTEGSAAALLNANTGDAVHVEWRPSRQ